MITFKSGKGSLVLTIASVALLLASCSTAPVMRDGKLQAQEGVVAVRLLDLGTVTVNEVSVQSEATGKIYSLQPIRFGQTVTSTFVGRLPAGRYQPKELTGVEGYPPFRWITARTFDRQVRCAARSCDSAWHDRALRRARVVHQ